MMMVVRKTERKIKETTRSNNQGHGDYLHESRHLCSYVATVLNGNILINYSMSKNTAVVDPSTFLYLWVHNSISLDCPCSSLS